MYGLTLFVYEFNMVASVIVGEFKTQGCWFLINHLNKQKKERKHGKKKVGRKEN